MNLRDSFNSYDCALKKSDHRCKAKATVQVTYHDQEVEDGPVPPPTYTLVSIHSPDWHSHVPDNSKHIADHIMQIMKDAITRNPCDRIGNIFSDFGWMVIFSIFLGPMVEKVLLAESQKYEHNKPLKAKILNSFPANRLSTLYAHRKTITGNIPGCL